MENSNRPVQRVIPIRSEFPNRINTSLNPQNSNTCIEQTCAGSGQQFKLINSVNDLSRGNSVNILDSLPFVQQNVNIMNINLQGMSQDTVNSFSQSPIAPKTYLQLADGRYVQIAQNIQPAQNPMSTILVQMPYKFVDQSTTNTNQPIMSSQFLLPSKVIEKSNAGPRFVTIGNNGGHCSNLLMGNQPVDKQANNNIQLLNDYQRTIKTNSMTDVNDHMSNGMGESKLNQNVNANVNIISIDKYQEICDMLLDRKLLSKVLGNEETVLVEFRLNQQKYQLRMTRAQKVEMEKLLISAGNQQRQMEILQVYQSEQRKNLQQRTSVVLNQIINKSSSNIVCNSPQIQTLNITKPIFPLNSVIMSVPQSQYNDGNVMQSSKNNYQNKNAPNQSTSSGSLQNSNVPVLTPRLPPAQSSIMSVPSIIREPIKEPIKQKRVTKAPINFTQNIPNLTSNQDMKPARSRRFNNMRRVLCDDQNSVTMPNCQEPFENLNDVAKRLVPYHILEECKEHKFDEVDRILSTTFSELSKRCTNLKRIASSITMHDILSEKDEEQLLIKRMQLDLEMDVFDQERVSSTIMVPQCTEDVVSGDGNNVIVIEDSPSSSPILAPLDRYNNDGDGILESMSFMESIDGIEGNDDNNIQTVPPAPGESSSSYNDVLDSLYNYDITDICNDIVEECAVLGDDDEIHWIDEDHKSPAAELVDNEADNQQSGDPDLDAAIKSILF